MVDFPPLDTSLFLAVVGQVVGGIWWASKLTAEVRALKTQLSAQRNNHEARIQKIERVQEDNEKAIARFEGVLARLDERTEKMQGDVAKLADWIMRGAQK